jgi:tellurite resistance protein TerB
MDIATTGTDPLLPDEATGRFLKALASEARQQLMLQFANGVELSVGEVAERLGIGQSTASQQLAQLKDGGLLTSRREAKTVYYRADKERIGAALDRLRGFLDGCC